MSEDSPKVIAPVKVMVTHCPGVSVRPFWSPFVSPSPCTRAICPVVHECAVVDVDDDVLVVVVVELELEDEVEVVVKVEVVLEVVAAGSSGTKTTSFPPLQLLLPSWLESPLPLSPLFPLSSPLLVL